MKHALQGVWFAVLLLLLAGCLSIGWFTQAALNYSYSFWYEQMDIGAHIDRFAPKNRYILGFQQTTREQRIEAFNEIAEAVHHHGKGLADIEFRYHYGTHKLLRQAEVEHLQDVANLIDVVKQIAIVALLAGGAGLLLLLRWRVIPRWRVQLLWLLGLGVSVAGGLLLVGPKQVFYQLHVWIFPENHQWFFYYQDSLMSTLMKAPDLFGGIAVAIGATGLLLFIALLWGISWLQRNPGADS